MPITTQFVGDNICLMQVSGVLQPAELADAQETAKRYLEAGGGYLKELIVLEDFQGWQKGVDWSDVSFYFEHGDDVKQIAVVGDSRWETEVFVFMGAGLRRAPVKFFPSDQLADARNWLAGPGV